MQHFSGSRSLSRLATLALTVLSLACGCVLSGAGQSEDKVQESVKAPSPKAVAEARIEPKWQERMSDMLKASGATDAWGLFSAGGWSNAGQVITLFSKGGQEIHGAVAQPGKKDFAVDRALTPAEAKAVRDAVAVSQKLSNVDEEVFDGLEFELVHMVKGEKGAAPTVASRLYVKQAGQKAHPDHDRVIAAFQALRPSKPAKKP